MVFNPPEYLQKKFLFKEKPRMGHSLLTSINQSDKICLIKVKKEIKNDNCPQNPILIFLIY